MGCSPVAAFAVNHPDRVRSMVLYWPVGGPGYRISSHRRFARHLAFAEEQGLSAVVELVRSHDKNFSADPRGGPWGQPIRNSDAFAKAYAALDLDTYLLTVQGMAQSLIDRDTAPGAEPEDLMRLDIPSLIVPGETNFTRPLPPGIWKNACRDRSIGTCRQTDRPKRRRRRECWSFLRSNPDGAPGSSHSGTYPTRSSVSAANRFSIGSASSMIPCATA